MKKKKFKDSKAAIYVLLILLIITLLMALYYIVFLFEKYPVKRGYQNKNLKEAVNDMNEYSINSLEVIEESSGDETNANVADNSKYTVIIDPGHGGEDPGTSIGDVTEKDINLTIALYLQGYLNDLGYDVIMTRSEDTFLDKYERAKFANSCHANIFVSLHCNYSEEEPKANGVETYYYENESEGAILAKCVHDSIIENVNSKDMQYQPNDYVVLKNTKMTAILVEMGYLSNKKEAENMTTHSYQKKMAHAIALGVNDYFENNQN